MKIKGILAGLTAASIAATTVAAVSASAAAAPLASPAAGSKLAKENAKSSGLGEAPIRWLIDDCIKFVEREIRRGNKYQVIIMDPPSYGRGPKGEMWKMEDNIFELIKLTSQILADDAIIYLINMYTTGLSPAVLNYMIAETVIKSHGGSVHSEDIGLPVRDTGLTLPCGSTARWEPK
jgi:23S rRNA (cytosine1962-C5)-methyltransferase